MDTASANNSGSSGNNRLPLLGVLLVIIVLLSAGWYFLNSRFQKPSSQKETPLSSTGFVPDGLPLPEPENPANLQYAFNKHYVLNTEIYQDLEGQVENIDRTKGVMNLKNGAEKFFVYLPPSGKTKIANDFVQADGILNAKVGDTVSISLSYKLINGDVSQILRFVVKATSVKQTGITQPNISPKSP